jgi:hypothetical protein
VWKLENGERAPSIATVAALCVVYELDDHDRALLLEVVRPHAGRSSPYLTGRECSVGVNAGGGDDAGLGEAVQRGRGGPQRLGCGFGVHQRAGCRGRLAPVVDSARGGRFPAWAGGVEQAEHVEPVSGHRRVVG